ADDPALYDIQTTARGPQGELPLTDEMLRTWSSGDLFGLTQAAGMGWKPEELLGPQFLVLSTQGGVRAPDGTPIALGYHTGHYEVGLLVQAAAREIKELKGVPFAAFCSDPCDGRTQGTTGMFDSLPYRNDAAMVLGRLIRSLPHSALSTSGQPSWLEMAKASARAVHELADRGLKTRDILTPASIRNAMVVHAACGGSTNLLLHIPAVAFAAGLPRPTIEEWSDVNRRVPRFVSVLPNGPVNHPTVRVFLAGGVPEIMLHLRELGLLELN